jgi:sulfopyruvate decarboxylase TPP-binding subunit
MSETPTATYADSIPAPLLHQAVRELGVTHILSVPDTHQKTLLALLMTDPELTTITLSTEDEAICANAGLWIGGAEALVVIQNVGLFAAMNALRGVALDMKVPTCMLVGQFGRDVRKPVEENASTGVRLIEPVLRTMGVTFYRLDHEADVGLLRKAFDESRSERKPVVVLIGAPTA